MNRSIFCLFLVLCGVANTGVALSETVLIPQGIMAVDGRTAPDLRLKNLDGQTFDIKEARGHWLFVHFWASWCAPCRREMPTIQAMAEQLASSPLELVLVNTAETEDEVFGFLGIVAPDFGSLLDLDGSTTERWQPRGLPSSFLVDPEGKIRYLALGGRQWDQSQYVEFLRGLMSSGQ